MDGEEKEMSRMTPQERKLFDAQGNLEAWEWTLRILRPWVESTREIGSPELTLVMEKALETAEIEADGANATVEAVREQMA